MRMIDDPNKPFVSVVTPFYNTDQFLEECIESVLAQTYENYEYLLVNNCSTDSSLEIAIKYADKDSRIKICSNEKFLSQVQNYNHALSLISGKSKYCKVVQADDWIFPECIEKMVEVGCRDPRVGIVSSYRLKGETVVGNGLPYPSTIVPGEELCRKQLLHDWSLFGSPTSVLYRADLIRSKPSFFLEGRYHEDTEICYEILADNDFGFVHQVLSFTRTDNESLTSARSKFNTGILDRYIQIHCYGKKFLKGLEFEHLHKIERDKYMNYLAESMFKPNSKELFAYHRNGLSKIGIALSWGTLFPFMMNVLADIILNPKNSAERLYGHFRKNRSR